MIPFELPAIVILALLVLWLRDRDALRERAVGEAEARREHRMALAYVASRDGEASLFAGAFLGGHHDLIARNFADFPIFRAAELEREEADFETGQ